MMLTGYKWYDDGMLNIRVDGYRKVSYLWYGSREAEQKYREKHGLKRKRIKWIYC